MLFRSLKPGVDPARSPLLEPLHSARRRWADWLYNSSQIPHTARWQAPLPTPGETIDYGQEVLAALEDKLQAGDHDDDFGYYVELSLYHELMHLKRMDHSPAFWALVAEVCPEYERARRWLRRHGRAPHAPEAHLDPC